MDSLTTNMIKRADLRGVVEAEAAHWRNLLPPEPAWEYAARNLGPFAGIAKTRLLSGGQNAPGVTVFARKARQGVRPVPVLGVVERIALRALTDLVLGVAAEPARTAADYRNFNLGPVFGGLDQKTLGLRLADAKYEYVVQADIAAFYQYVDHGQLMRELELRTDKVTESKLLVELLGEVQNKVYGLPQLFASSDRLSEIYIDALERDLRRSNVQVWRFNDDFRILANGYGHAQQLLERVARSAHALGLVLNEAKSSIVLFRNYYWDALLLDGSTPGVDTDEINTDDIETWDDEYPDLEAEDLTGDVDATLNRIDLKPGQDDEFKPRTERPLNLKRPSSRDVRDLRKAIGIAKATKHKIATERIRQMIEFLPELMPRLSEYLVALSEGAGQADVAEAWESLRELSEVLNEWQLIWLTYIGRRANLFTEQSRARWLMDRYNESDTGLLHAESAYALALIGQISFAELDQALRTQPAALAQWYVLGIKALPSVDQSLIDAVRNSDPLYRVLLDAA